MKNCDAIRVDGKLLCHLRVVVASDVAEVVPLLSLFEFSLKYAFWAPIRYFWVSSRNSGISLISVALCNFEVAFPVTFFGGSHVAPRTSLVL